jgi:uncharacterized integral membrane protein
MSFGALLSFLFILFAIHNHDEVVVDLLRWRYRVETWALAMIALCIGLVLPAGFVVAQRLASARRERALRRRVAELEQELVALRNVALVEPLPGEPAVGTVTVAGGAAGLGAATPPAAAGRPSETATGTLAGAGGAAGAAAGALLPEARGPRARAKEPEPDPDLAGV